MSNSVTSISSCMSGSGMARIYFTIRTARRAMRVSHPLYDGKSHEKKIPDVGSFVNDGDGRHKNAHMRHSYTHTRNTCTSFCRDTLICTSCTAGGEHQVLHKEAEQRDNADAPPQCFVLADQNFPAVLPAEGGGSA